MKSIRLLVSRTLLLSLLAVLYGCATSAIPSGYTGPTAVITDTVEPISNSQVAIFMVSRVNDRMIANSSVATSQANRGMGMGFAFTRAVEREVPTGLLTLRIEGLTQSASDIQAIFARNYSVSGTVQLKARPNTQYVVKGILNRGRRAVWVEEEQSGKRVTQVIEQR